MSQLVSEQEKAFLLLTARRVLKYKREAEVRGEKYQDLVAPEKLASGLRAMIRFDPSAFGYEVHVVIMDDISFTTEEKLCAAKEILGAEARLLYVIGDGPPTKLVYVRK
jgi:hypothetical protein